MTTAESSAQRKRPLFTDARPPEDIHTLLAHYYGDMHAEAIVDSLMEPPSQTTIRVNTLTTSRDNVLRDLNVHLDVHGHGAGEEGARAKPHPEIPDLITISVSGPNAVVVQPSAVLIDVGCGEAVLRGADIFAPGVVAMSSGVAPGDEVSVYVQQFGSQLTKGAKLKPGLLKASAARHVGNGAAIMGREELFGDRHEVPRGLAVRMGARIFTSPSLHGVLSDQMFLQNLPSTVAGHTLGPMHPGQRVLDMCAAPGGKTTHLAALQPLANVVALDRSARRLTLVEDLARKLRATNVETRCMSAVDAPAEFGAESFDHVLLDPPCSALGLRPRLTWNVSLAELDGNVRLQRRLLHSACEVLRPGGTLVYSTCTINPRENEENVSYALSKLPCLRLVGSSMHLGLPGVAGAGLSDEECKLVQRFDPSTEEGRPSIGFFVSKFVKEKASHMGIPILQQQHEHPRP